MCSVFCLTSWECGTGRRKNEERCRELGNGCQDLPLLVLESFLPATEVSVADEASLTEKAVKSACAGEGIFFQVIPSVVR